MTLWLMLTLALGFAAWLAVWSRYPTRARGLAVGAFLLASPVAGAALFLSLGWPVPLYPHVSAPSGDAYVLGVKMVPDEAIYIMLDGPTPRLFSLPWNAEQASKLQRMMEGAEGEGRIKARMNEGFSEGEFYMEGSPEGQERDKPQEPQGFIYERHG